MAAFLSVAIAAQSVTTASPGRQAAAEARPAAAARTEATARSSAAARSNSVAERLEPLLRRLSLPGQAFVGLAVADPDTGELLYTSSGNMLFVPASNTKLFATALALSRLGPDHRMETRLSMDGAFLPARGELRGHLILAGAGDPSISGRTYPYAAETARQRQDPLAALEPFADAVAARGIRVIHGDIIGDDTAYDWEPFREGWSQDDALYGYGAPVSALTVNDNALRMTIRPGAKAGEPAVIELTPEIGYFDVLNEVATVQGGAARMDWERLSAQRLLVVRGQLPAGSPAHAETVAVDDPALFAAHALRHLLLQKGVEVRGVARARHRMHFQPGTRDGETNQRPADSSLIHLRLSPPLAELLAVVNKESQNLHAEMLLLEVARAASGSGSRARAFQELSAFLREARIAPEAVRLADGSGLARLNLVSPEATVALLSAMWRGPHRAVWLASLPVGAAEGTLRNRFAGDARAAAILAKTGTLRGVIALSGYARTPSGRTLAFSAMVNNHGGPSSQSREFLDTIALELASLPE
ncbi:MAG: D-alanyl-D-alanine carboxypeptidase/D-alanyl-D-alanine-endopeptidase [Bryobacterales bacterium]|jgi:D-alanyl-D-alanine carboxypeptidase/D-alanyl-D-alanine-endopeptidase (penicillin-binding protein 4)|nr:D-alanyl-D-alanine carboxypeptidase/D-alanyl-D-alanine-endopeptidase [Bryobacterales bacterium]